MQTVDHVERTNNVAGIPTASTVQAGKPKVATPTLLSVEFGDISVLSRTDCALRLRCYFMRGISFLIPYYFRVIRCRSKYSVEKAEAMYMKCLIYSRTQHIDTTEECNGTSVWLKERRSSLRPTALSIKQYYIQ